MYIVLLYNLFYFCKVGSNVPSFSLILVIWAFFPLFLVNFCWFCWSFKMIYFWFHCFSLFSILYFINFCSNIYSFLPSVCCRFRCSFSSILGWKIRLLIWNLFFFLVDIYSYKFSSRHCLSCISFGGLYLHFHSSWNIFLFPFLFILWSIGYLGLCCLVFTYLWVFQNTFCYWFLIEFHCDQRTYLYYFNNFKFINACFMV